VSAPPQTSELPYDEPILAARTGLFAGWVGGRSAKACKDSREVALI
jgi:hypothetical protein